MNLRKLDQSTAVPSLSRDNYDELAVPVPPEQIQAALVARIDALFAEVDDGEAALRRARSDLKTWRKSLLKAAVTGDLTADWRAAHPPQESGADLLARILTARRTRWQADPRNKGKQYTEPAGPDVSELPDLPDGWTWAGFEQLFDVVSDKGLKLKERDYLKEGRYPVIDQGAAHTSGYTDDEALVRHPEAPWILFGDHTRRFKYVDHPFCVGADGVKIMSPDRGWDPGFAFRSLQAAHFEDRGYSRHFQFVRELAFALPSLPEQEAIVDLLNGALAETDNATDATEELGEAAATLRQSILSAAFRGELGG